MVAVGFADALTDGFADAEAEAEAVAVALAVASGEGLVVSACEAN